MTMELRDLPARNDPKGGVRSGPIIGEGFIEAPSSTVWRTIALIEAAVLATGITSFSVIGLDNVKHSEIQQIMDTRAPYMHAKPEIEARFKALEVKDLDLTTALRDLKDEYKKSDEVIMAKLQTLEVRYYRDHPKQPLDNP